MKYNWNKEQIEQAVIDSDSLTETLLKLGIPSGGNGCCAFCGWKEHPEILNFHHKDPSTKEFGFSSSAVGNLSMERILKEIDKCILLCPNCHQWLHFQETAKLGDD